MALEDLLQTAQRNLPLLNDMSPQGGSPLSPFTTAPQQPAEPQVPQAPTPPRVPASLSVAPVTSPQVQSPLQGLQDQTQGFLATAPLQFSQGQVNPSIGPLLNHGVGGFGSPGADVSAAIMDNVSRLRGVDPHGSYTGPDVKAGGNRVIRLAKTQLGVPYDMGAYDPAGGGSAAIDCSGLTKWVFSRLGVDLPHSAAQQSEMFPKLTAKQLKPGDLVFYDYGRLGGASDHVAIYAGNGRQIAASSSGGQVEVQPVDWSHFIWGGASPLGGRPANPQPPNKRPTVVRQRRTTGSPQQR